MTRETREGSKSRTAVLRERERTCHSAFSAIESTSCEMCASSEILIDFQRRVRKGVRRNRCQVVPRQTHSLLFEKLRWGAWIRFIRGSFCKG